MGWDNYHTKLTAPVSLSDIAYTVGGSAPYKLGSMITNGTINPATRYKPVAYNSVKALTEAQRRERNYGLSMSLLNSLTATYQAGKAISAGAFAWNYERPRGASYNEWFRARDFDGYVPGEAFPFQYTVLPNPCFRLNTPRVTDEDAIHTIDAITRADLQGDGSSAPHGTYVNLSQLTFGVVIGSVGSNYPSWAKTFSAGDVPFTLDLPSSWASGNYDVVFFFTDQSFDGTFVDSTGTYVLSAYPHFVWTYSSTLGLTYDGSEIDTTRKNLTVSIATRSGAVSYVYIDVFVTSGGTTIIDTRVARTAGTLTTTPWFFTLYRDEGWPVNGRYFIRLHTSYSKYYEEEFQPEESIIPDLD